MFFKCLVTERVVFLVGIFWEDCKSTAKRFMLLCKKEIPRILIFRREFI